MLIYAYTTIFRHLGCLNFDSFEVIFNMRSTNVAYKIHFLIQASNSSKKTVIGLFLPFFLINVHTKAAYDGYAPRKSGSMIQNN